jgi:hypothetical protein
MAVLTHLETDTGTNVDISAATAVGAYTSTGDKLIMVDVSIDAVAGNGDYVMYVTRQIGGSGSAYRILPQTTMAAASGLTAISGQSGWITVRNGDVLTCYVDGLAGDTSTPDWSTRWFELAGVTAAAVADAVWDEATADHTTASSFGALDANVDAILADTGTDGVVLKAAGLADDAVTAIQSGLATPTNITAASGVALGATQGAITWGQQKIVANVAGEGALNIVNSSAAGYGLNADGEASGIRGYGHDSAGISAYASASGSGILAAAGKGVWAHGSTQDVDGYDPNQTVATVTNLTNLPAAPTDWLTAAALKADAVDKIIDEVVVGTYTMRQLLAVMAAALAGKATGGGTTTVTFSGVDGASDVIVATVDANGNRSAVTLTV